MNSQMSHSKKAQAVIQPKNILMFTQKVPLQVLRMWKRTGLLDHNKNYHNTLNFKTIWLLFCESLNYCICVRAYTYLHGKYI